MRTKRFLGGGVLAAALAVAVVSLLETERMPPLVLVGVMVAAAVIVLAAAVLCGLGVWRAGFAAALVVALCNPLTVIAASMYLPRYVGPVTIDTSAGFPRPVFWKFYPGVEGEDAAAPLERPSAEAQLAAGLAVLDAVRDGLPTDEVGGWTRFGQSPDWHRPDPNGFRGEALLQSTYLNGWESRTVPETAEGRQGLMAAAVRVAAEYGFEPSGELPPLRDYEGGGSPVVFLEHAEGRTLILQVHRWSASAAALEQYADSIELGSAPDAFTVSYEAEPSIPEGRAAEYRERLAAYAGLAQPPDH